MGGQLATTSESTGHDHSTAAYPPCKSYRDSIRSVAVSGGMIRSPPFIHSSSSGSSYSGASYPSNNSGFSSGSASAAAGFRAHCAQELRNIAGRMVSDGYTHGMVQAFIDTPNILTYAGPDDALERWFFELDVDWVLQIRKDHSLRQLEDKLASSLQDLVGRWIRALTVIVRSISDLMTGDEPTTALARFGKASIAKMLAFVNTIVPAQEGHAPAEKLWAVLNIYVCVSGASSFKWSHTLISQENQSIFDEINSSLSRAQNRLNEAIFSTMEEVRRTLMEDDDSWAIEIPRGGGEVHRNTRFMVDCIVLMKSGLTSLRNDVCNNYTADGPDLCDLVDDTIDYLKDLLWRKSEVCSDPSLRYIFLLNNSYFVTHQLQSSKHLAWESPPESGYIDSYFDVSWGHVLSCISKLNPGSRHHRNNASSLVIFLSAFYKTCQAQKFWKVPSPELRGMLRKTITERVVSGYRKYLEEHPELEKYVSCGSSTPDDLEEMLGELFEG